MKEFVLIAVDASVYSAWLFLLSVGLALVFGVQRVLNVAHGAAYTFGAYAATTSVAMAVSQGYGAGIQILLLILVAIPVGAVLGLAVEALVINPLRKAEQIVSLLGTYAAFLILEDLSKLIWGGTARYASAARDSLGTIDISSVPYARYDLLVVVLALIVGIGLSFVMNKTKAGKLLEAVSHDREMSSAVGINYRLIFVITFCVGMTFGALAGSMTAPRIAVAPGIGAEVIVVAFAVVVIGGLGSVLGAAIGSFLVGVTKATTLHLAPATELFAIYFVMALVLAFRHEGLIRMPQARRI